MALVLALSTKVGIRNTGDPIRLEYKLESSLLIGGDSILFGLPNDWLFSKRESKHENKRRNRHGNKRGNMI